MIYVKMFPYPFFVNTRTIFLDSSVHHILYQANFGEQWAIH